MNSGIALTLTRCDICRIICRQKILISISPHQTHSTQAVKLIGVLHNMGEYAFCFKSTVVSNSIKDLLLRLAVVISVLVEHLARHWDPCWAMAFFFFLHCSPYVMKEASDLCHLGDGIFFLYSNMLGKPRNTKCMVCSMRNM